jgi:hypothetical protein
MGEIVEKKVVMEEVSHKLFLRTNPKSVDIL